MRAARLAAVLAILVACPSADAGTLAVWDAGAWRPFWRSDRAPERWSAPDPTVARALRWQRIAEGLDWCDVRLQCEAPARRVLLVVARLDPRVLRLSLQMDLSPGDLKPAWSIERAPKDALLAVNAGQFTGAMPWGWVVIGGRQRLRPGFGPLSSAVAIDPRGGVRWSHGDSRLDPSGVETGFQSYPTLLAGGGRVPAPLRSGGLISLTHRDSRLALGQTRDGRLLLALTRYDVVGEVAGGIPLGPTTPEMAAILGALGATDAVMLDGGISSQLLLRDPTEESPREWPGIRKVPLALLVTPRSLKSVFRWTDRITGQ